MVPVMVIKYRSQFIPDAMMPDIFSNGYKIFVQFRSNGS